MGSAPLHPIDRYQPGRPWAVCDRCGLTYRHDQLRKEWTGLLVCPADYDCRPTDIDPPNIYPEGVPIPDARPDLLDVLGDNTTTAEDL